MSLFKTVIMKVFLATFFFLLCFNSNAQVYSPHLAGFAGFNVIYYPYGYYQGQVYNGFANGTGTFYFNDGSFYYGNFYGGYWHGAGVLVSRLYGYVSGCFNTGMYLGPCQGINNPYQSSSQIEYLVSNVQSEAPNNAEDSYDSFSLEDYEITKVDGGTQMGKTLLGRYK
jgi:hypothetical protein